MGTVSSFLKAPDPFRADTILAHDVGDKIFAAIVSPVFQFLVHPPNAVAIFEFLHNFLDHLQDEIAARFLRTYLSSCPLVIGGSLDVQASTHCADAELLQVLVDPCVLQR